MSKEKELQAKVDILEKELVANKEEIDSLKAQIANSSTPSQEPTSSTLPSFEHGGRKYQFTAGQFFLGGKKVTAKEAIESKEIKALIVDKGYGFIKEVK